MKPLMRIRNEQREKPFKRDLFLHPQIAAEKRQVARLHRPSFCPLVPDRKIKRKERRLQFSSCNALDK